MTQQRFWNQTDVWFFDSFQIRQSIFLWKAGLDVNIILSGQLWWKFYHQAFISFIATKYSSISHGQLTVVSVNNFTFQGKVLMKISPPGFIAFIASKYSNVPISRGQLVDHVVLVNNTSAIWTFQTWSGPWGSLKGSPPFLSSRRGLSYNFCLFLGNLFLKLESSLWVMRL